MSIQAKLIIDDLEVNVLKFHFSYNKQSDTNGNPTNKTVFNGITLVIEARKALNLADWAISQNQTKQFELHILPRILGAKTRKMMFYDGHLLGLKSNFSASGAAPMTETLSISCGGVKDSNSSLEYEAYWRTTFDQQDVEATLLTSDQEEQEEEIDLKFIAKLERLDGYKGEFGFDWMRDDYKTICEDYEKLKKEYTPTKIHGKDYFVPWLSLFPKQKNVKLKLIITEIEGTATDTDIIKLPSKSGIQFEPNELKVSEANGKEIAVICETPLSNDTVISLLDKDDQEVGKLNVFKNANHEELQFNITPVRILRSVSPERDKDTIESMIDRGFGDTNKDLTGDLKNLENYLNTQSLNQALLQCSIGKVYDIIIDEEQWISDRLIIDEGCVFKDDGVLDVFYKEYERQHPQEAKKKGLVVFLSPIRQDGAGGEGDLYDIDAKHCAIYYTNLWDKVTFAHEIGHVLGLIHSFHKFDQARIIDNNRYVREVDDYINDMIKNGKTENEIAEKWTIYKDSYADARGFLKVYYHYFKDKTCFSQATTENIMDYSSYSEEDVVIRTNPFKAVSFWKNQWEVVQSEIKKYYN